MDRNYQHCQQCGLLFENPGDRYNHCPEHRNMNDSHTWTSADAIRARCKAIRQAPKVFLLLNVRRTSYYVHLTKAEALRLAKTGDFLALGDEDTQIVLQGRAQ